MCVFHSKVLNCHLFMRACVLPSRRMTLKPICNALAINLHIRTEISSFFMRVTWKHLKFSQFSRHVCLCFFIFFLLSYIYIVSYMYKFMCFKLFLSSSYSVVEVASKLLLFNASKHQTQKKVDKYKRIHRAIHLFHLHVRTEALES